MAFDSVQYLVGQRLTANHRSSEAPPVCVEPTQGGRFERGTCSHWKRDGSKTLRERSNRWYRWLRGTLAGGRTRDLHGSRRGLGGPAIAGHRLPVPRQVPRPVPRSPAGGVTAARRGYPGGGVPPASPLRLGDRTRLRPAVSRRSGFGLTGSPFEASVGRSVTEPRPRGAAGAAPRPRRAPGSSRRAGDGKGQAADGEGRPSGGRWSAASGSGLPASRGRRRGASGSGGSAAGRGAEDPVDGTAGVAPALGELRGGGAGGGLFGDPAAGEGAPEGGAAA